MKKEILEGIIRKNIELYMLRYYTIRGKPITFKIRGRNKAKAIGHRPWQVDIIKDRHENKVVRKSRQLGLSEMGIAEALWFADVHSGTKTMFTFPRDRQMRDFVKTRLDPVLDSNPYFRSILDSKMDSIEVKRIRDSFMMFRSAWGGALGEGVDVDFLSFDEYDRMSDGVELAFRESMKSSKYGLLRRWSTPTIPGRGIDLAFQRSDQRFYMHKCESCNHYQVLSVEDNIKQVKPDGINYVTEEIEDGTFEYVCAKCGKPLDRWYNGEWVAKYPDRKGTRGYHISQLNAVWISADDIKRNELQYTSRQIFTNYVIGESYASEGLIVSEDDVLGAVRFDAPKTSRAGYVKVVAGIDWGHVNYLVLLGMRENGQLDLMNLWTFRDNPRVPLEPVHMFASVLKPYNPDLIVADEGYGADRNTLLMQLFKGKTWACRYKTFKKVSQPMNNWNESSRVVTVDKTLTVQNMLHKLKAQEIGFWRPEEKLMMFMKHVGNVRIMDVEEDGDIYAVATRVGDDHLSSALNYSLIGMERFSRPYEQDKQFIFDFF